MRNAEKKLKKIRLTILECNDTREEEEKNKQTNSHQVFSVTDKRKNERQAKKKRTFYRNAR